MAAIKLLLLSLCLAAAIAQVTEDFCPSVCANPRQVLCPGPATPADCRSDQVFKPNGSFCRCCNACYTLVGPNQNCLNVPEKGLYYQCSEGYTCSYNRHCEEQ
ncbi:hypothetical protein Cfor_08904 [Coptotermes formosanus]|uniref:Uncharacterized protein n=1 Tax=Coptotermes formosanus TaxID=36987 RepID=A0A6L2Q8T9_COPFO|nr:hypothetical protein Cfor_08904 [Coptotermes formosanus]